LLTALVVPVSLLVLLAETGIASTAFVELAVVVLLVQMVEGLWISEGVEREEDPLVELVEILAEMLVVMRCFAFSLLTKSPVMRSSKTQQQQQQIKMRKSK
jgi:hypothetical protein